MNATSKICLSGFLSIAVLLIVDLPVFGQDSPPPISEKKSPRVDEPVKGTKKAEYKNGYYCTSQRVKLAESFEQSLVGPGEGLTEMAYPGAIIYMNDYLDGSYNVVPSRRAPITLYTDFYDTAGEDVDLSEIVENVTSSGIANSINTLVNRKGTTQTLDTEMTIAQFSSSEQLGFELNASASYGGFSGSGSFGFDRSDEKEKVVAQFMQRYFAVRIDGSKFLSPDDWFESPAEAERVLEKTVDRGPLLYVSSVVYGRCLYFGFESDHSEQEITAALQASYSGTGDFDADSTLEHKKVISDSKIKYVSIGGAADASGRISTLEDFAELINDPPSNLDAGVPIAYVFRFVKNNKIAFVNVATEFTQRTCVAVTKGLEVQLSRVINRGHDCELTTGTGCRIFALAPKTPKNTFDIYKEAGIDNTEAQNLHIAFHAIYNMFGGQPSWAKDMRAVGHVEFKMKPPADDYWEIREGDNAKDIPGRFVDYSKIFQVLDHPETKNDERDETGFCIISTFCDDGEAFMDIQFVRFSQINQITFEPPIKEFIGLEQDLGNGDGWMRYGVTFQFK